ncbi:hypothetical protein BpHYR1_052275 [Brachionus plicatilis]|uniref:Uncharacterized protein n=1 Tax=Brachionus plicatilis TaxID=10195 RepID=A0A3M7PZD1_BRAPC|nr:hypothetical protein BpHYR1_052275 [Brachionus plicatilis]
MLYNQYEQLVVRNQKLHRNCIDCIRTVVLEDHGDMLNNKVKRQAVEFLKKQKENLEQIFTTAVKNRDIVMDKAKIRHDRLIRKFEYELGDLVLTDHVQLKRGQCSGLAHKYFGPFKIVGKNANGVNYLIQDLNSKCKNVFNINKSGFKIYFGSIKQHMGYNTDSQGQSKQ